MDYETAEGPQIGPALRGLGLNLLCRDLAREGTFLADVLAMQVLRQTADFALLRSGSVLVQLHSDGSFASHPLHGLLPEAGPRGAGLELRLYEIDPDAACARVNANGPAMVLAPPRDKPGHGPGHGLREAVILSPEGYAWVPSRPIR